jgi:hypothetical protein
LTVFDNSVDLKKIVASPVPTRPGMANRCEPRLHSSTMQAGIAGGALDGATLKNRRTKPNAVFF